MSAVNNRVAALERPQSPGEEIANSISHGLGLLAALIAAPFLLVTAAQRSSGAVIAGVSVFVGTMVLLYLTSTLYHGFTGNRTKRVFQLLDHCAIFLLIAGSYTPFTLGVLRGPWGWTLFSLVWGLAVAGVVLKAVGGTRYPLLSTGLYLSMGWLVLIAIRPLWLALPLPGMLWLIAGGVAYTAGVAFFAADHRLRYAHFVWHLFVIAGSVCHFVAVYRYAV